MSSFKKATWFLAAAAFVAFLQPSRAVADPVLVILFSGLDLKYGRVGDTYKLCDATHCDGNIGEQVYSDPLSSMTFGLDNDGDGVAEVPLGTLATDIWADIRIDLAGLPLSGAPVTGGATNLDNIFDLLTQSSTPGWGIALNVQGFTAAYDEVNGQLVFGGIGVTSDIHSQNLPFGLIAGTPVIFGILSAIVPGTLSNDGTYITGFTASGGGAVLAPSAVPEPGTLSLLGAGLLALTAAARRRS